MRGTAARPYGVQFRQPTNVKARGAMVVHKNTDSPGWTQFWGANYDWTFQQAGLDHIAALGGTSVKVTPATMDLIATGAAGRTAVDRLHKWCDYAASKSLSLYWSLSYNTTAEVATTDTQKAAVAVALASITKDYPTTGIDLYNEPDGIGALSPSAVTSMSAVVFPAVRAVTTIPLTVSVGAGKLVGYNQAGDDNTAWLAAIKPWCDFWDFHLYVTGTHVVPAIPGDLAAFRASTYYKPWVLGEAGNPVMDAGGWIGGTPQQTAVYTMLQKMSLEPDCLGVYAFCLTDYDNVEFGLFTQAFDVERSWMTNIVRQWRAVH